MGDRWGLTNVIRVVDYYAQNGLLCHKLNCHLLDYDERVAVILMLNYPALGAGKRGLLRLGLGAIRTTSFSDSPGRSSLATTTNLWLAPSVGEWRVQVERVIMRSFISTGTSKLKRVRVRHPASIRSKASSDGLGLL